LRDHHNPLEEPERLAAIAASELLEHDTIPALDRVVRTAARLLGAPVAQLNVITSDQQIPVSHVGGAAWGRAVDLDRSYCQHVVHTGEPLVVADAREDDLVSSSVATAESGIVAYLSVPIVSPRAESPLATLCVVDFEPRDWTEDDVASLSDLAAWALSEIELRTVHLRDQARTARALKISEAHLRAIYDGTYEYIGLLSPEGKVLNCNRASLDFAGNRREDVIGEDFWDTPWFTHTPGAPERLRKAISRAAGGEFVRYEATLNRPADSPLTFDFSLHPVMDENGEVVFIVPEGRDITDVRRADAALRWSEERYRKLFDSLDEGFCVIDMVYDDEGRPVDYRFVEANPAFVHQTGLDGAVGRTVREMVANHEVHWLERYDRVASTGEPVRFEAESGGLGRHFDVYAFRVGGEHERRVAVLFRDVTEARRSAAERERLLAALEVERARLVEVIRRAPAFMVVLRGREHVVELVNDAYLQLIGHRDVVGMPLFESVPEARGQGFETLLDEVLESGEPFTGRGLPITLRRTPDAEPEERLVDVAYVPLTEADGTRSGIVVLGTDVTEQARSHREIEAARDRAERLQALTAALARTRSLDDVADVVVADMVVALGARTGALAGRHPDGESMLLLRTIGFPDDVVEAVRQQPLEMRSPLTECFVTRSPIWIEHRGGEDGLDANYPPIAPVWDSLGVHSAAFVPLVAGGETVGVISFAFTDEHRFSDEERTFLLTLGQQAALAVERARLFDAERTARDEAERANRVKSEFLAVMSHELRTPLNAIGGYADLMEMGIRGPVSDLQREDLRRIQSSQRHLLGLINEVLNYAKLETGTVRYDIEEIRLRDVLEGAEALITPQAQARGLSLRISLCEQDLVVRADVEKMRQILVNLLSNAVKFTDPGGAVELGCEVDDGWVRMFVRDSGIGIEPDQLDRIFEPFVQVRSDLTRTAEGTGLGLAISRDLARGMGGDLLAESEPGHGSTFTLRLPTV
jgi:PAS domain S-box-containing protein